MFRNTSRLKGLIGWTPNVELADMIEMTVDWYRSKSA
jgi:nucleoside-diphosphate-sugar epimerase